MCKHSASSRIQLTILKRTEISDCDFFSLPFPQKNNNKTKQNKKKNSNKQIGKKRFGNERLKNATNIEHSVSSATSLCAPRSA